MILTKLFAKQLRQPSGVFGRMVLPRLFNRRNSALNDLTLKSLALQPHDRVLEVGCGGGYLLHQMSAIIVDGLIAAVDLSPAMVAFCQKRYRSLIKDGQLQIRCASAGALPYPSGYFTKACTVNTLFYLPDASRATSELWRVLADDGTLVICFTAKKSLENRDFTSYGLTLYEADQVQRLLDSSGFQRISMIPGSDRYRAFTCAVGRK
jgi:ubiquinone/menaquinone biosynthesis C-methylase UbiE